MLIFTGCSPLLWSFGLALRRLGLHYTRIGWRAKPLFASLLSHVKSPGLLPQREQSRAQYSVLSTQYSDDSNCSEVLLTPAEQHESTVEQIIRIQSCVLARDLVVVHRNPALFEGAAGGRL